MRQKWTTFILAGALCAITANAFAQNADKNTAGPTGNQLQLRLTEPAAGATIAGSSVRVTIDYARTVFGAGSGTKFGEANFPHPIFDVFLDNKLARTLKGGEANVVTLENVPVGSHKIVVMAKNISGEVIDRKEVSFLTTALPATAIETTERRPEPPRAEPAPAPAPRPIAETPRSEPTSLPSTGTSYPRVALAGLALMVTGFALARKTR